MKMINKKKKPKFLRKDWHKKSKLGIRRKSKLRWVRPRGRHNKLRLKKKSRGAWPSIGYSQSKAIRGKIQGLNPVYVKNLSDLLKVKKDEEMAVIASIGMKKKIEIAKKAKELGIKSSINLEKFLEKAESFLTEKKKVKSVVEKKRKTKGPEQKEEQEGKEKKETTEDEKEEAKKPVLKERMEDKFRTREPKDQKHFVRRKSFEG